MRQHKSALLLVITLYSTLLSSGLPLRGQSGDVVPPEIHVLESGAALADGSLFRRAVQPTVQVTDASAVTVDSTLDGAPFVSGASVSGEGQHDLAVSATDAAGNTASATVHFTIDTTPPAFVSVLPVSGSVTAAAQVTLQGEVDGAAAVTVDGQAASLNGGQWSAGPYTLSEGERAWTLVATDAAGNTTTRTHRIVRDSIAPVVAIGQPADGAVRNATPVQVVGTASDPHLEGVTVNGTAATLAGTTWVAANVPLAEGSTQLLVEARDAAGNIGRAQRTVVLDTQPPAVAITDPAPGTVVPGATLSVGGTASDPHLDRVEVNGVRAQLANGAWTATVPLTEGANDLVARAFDTLGWSAADTVAVIRDSHAPAIHIEQPADGAYLNAASVAVQGTVEAEAGLTVTVNGVAATIAGGAFSAPAVPLVEGENRLIARIVDHLGNQGAHTEVVYRDTVAPTFVASEPAGGALALPLEAEIDLTFSEPLRTPLAAASWRLETAAGQALPAQATVNGAVVTIRPQSPLPSHTALRLVLTAGLVDRAGNALAAPPTLTFTTVNRDAPPVPVLAAPPPAFLCSPRLALSGTAQADTTVQVTGGAGAAAARSGADGAFAVTVDLLPDALNHLELTARDSDGNRSAPLAVDVVDDCTPPQVTGAALAAGAVNITFSERIAAASLAGAVAVKSAAGTIAGTVAAAPGGAGAVFTPGAPLPSGSLRVEVSQAVRDLAGNPLAYPYSQVLGSAVTESFLAGRVLDNSTGRPLSGAVVAVVTTNGAVNPDPQPEQTTGADGRFRIPVAPGTHSLLVARGGYTPVLRAATTTAAGGTNAFDPRLTPAASSIVLAAGGGIYPAAGGGAGGLTLTIPSGALAATAPVAVTALEEQGLPALLPYGWSPRGAVWVDLGGATLVSAASLNLPVAAPDGTSLAVVRLDVATLQWHTVALATAAGGRVTVSVAGEGGYAAVEADAGDVGDNAPPAAVAGTVLGSSPAPAADAVTSAALTFAPATVLPSQRSLVTVGYTLNGAPPSGVPLTLTVREQLTLLDGTVRREAPYQADVVLYRAAPSATGAARSRFGLRPSQEAQTVPLQIGAEDVTVERYAGETVRGNVLGPLGGTVASPEGDRVDIPANALSDPTAVTLTRLAEGDLPAAVPAGTAFLGLLDLDLGDRELAVPAALTLELGAAPAAGQQGLLFEILDAEAGGAPLFRPVASLAATATGWTTAAIDPQDLPWPGVRESGLYLFARLTAGVGYLRGTVFDVDGSPLADALVSSPAVPWIQLADGGAQVGRYVLPAAPAAYAITALNQDSGNSGSGTATVASAGARIDLDLLIRLTGPRVVEVNPANGATSVPPGVEPTIRFSVPVDVATLASGILLYDGASQVSIRLEVQGALVHVRPLATLRPAAVYELRVNTAVRDLHGHRLDGAVTSSFTTAASQLNNQLDLTRIHLFEPVNGMARVLGRPGAVPAGTVVVVEKTTGTSLTVSGTAGPDGGFQLLIAATLSDTLLLHVVLEGHNEIILELTPFLTADGHGAYVKAMKAASFTTLDGITVHVAEGTFLEPAHVSLQPVAPSTVTAPVPADLPVVAAFQLDFGGVVAQKPLQISMPTPAGVTHDDLLLGRAYNILGRNFWMLYDLMRRDGNRITTELLPNETAQSAGAPQAVARLASVTGKVPAGTPRLITGASFRGDGKEYLPGAANPGLYIVMENTTFLDFVAFPFIPGMFAYFLQIGVDGCIASIDASVERLLGHDAVLLPTRRGQRFTVVGRDLGTDFKLFEKTFDPPASGTITVLPPDNFGDRQPPLPVAGSPLRFFPLTPSDEGDELLDRGIHAALEHGAQESQGTLTITGDADSVQPRAQVRLLGLDDTKDQAIDAGENGAFTLTESVVPGNRYLLAIGAKVGVADSLEIAFSEALPDGFPGIEVLDHAGRSVAPRLDPAGTRETVRIVPQPAWQAGETYTLRLQPSLADAAGNAWKKQLDLNFEVDKSSVLDTFNLTAVRDIARLGSLLFVAADTQGLVVMDASDPAHLQNLISGNITFPFPLADPVTGVTVDPHGRVLVVGGGVTGPGQLKIFDPLALDPVAVAAHPDDVHVRYAAFKGSTIISDKLGADPGTSLPEGRPRRVTVLSDDQSDRWRIGVDAPPAGVALSPSTSPADGSEYTVTVSGSNATAKLPVSFKNLTRGRFNRVDANESGHYQLQLSVRAGDRVELLRNKASYAYVATQGAGIEVVNVDAFYNETPEDPNHPNIQSDVIGIYSGFDDPSLSLCSRPVSDIGAATLDLGTLFSRKPPHPLTVVGLIGLRGLALLESKPDNVGQISFFNEMCLDLAGSAQVSAMQVVESYPFDFNNNGQLEESEERDYILVAHRQNGVLIIDATDRDNLQLVGWVKLPSGGQAAHLSVDRDRRRLYVSGYGGGIYVVDFDKAPSTQVVDKNQDGTDDRVLETIALSGNTNAAVFLLPELGIAYAGGLGRGLTSVAVGTPRLTAVAESRGDAGTPDADNAAHPRWRNVSRLAPLGVPTVAEKPGDPDLPASFRVLASLPGVTGETVKLDVMGLGPSGLPIAGAGDADAITDLPRAALDGTDHGVELHRQATNRWEEGYQLYLSEEIATLADLRAARHYERTTDEKKEENCKRCDPEKLKIPEDAREVLSGNQVAVRFPAALRSTLGSVYASGRLDEAEIAVDSVTWDLAPAIRQEPALNPSTGAGDVIPGTLLHSGEMSFTAVDFAIKSRGFDIDFTRTYRNQTVGAGPLGPGWDYSYNQHLRELPNGDIEFFDGRGRRERFTKQQDGKLKAPAGRFFSLDRTAAGWVMLDAGHNLARFDRFGRLISLADSIKDSADTGNEMLFAYDPASRLVRITDTLDRKVLLSYDAKGRLETLKDFDSREVRYSYDSSGRLASVTSPRITVGDSTYPQGLTTRYEYREATGSLTDALHQRDNLSAWIDPRGTRRAELTYTDADGDGRAEEVTAETWGSGTINLSYGFEGGQTTVTDRRGHSRVYNHNETGNVTRIQDAAGGVTSFQYNSDGLVTQKIEPLQRTTTYTYDTGSSRRSQGNLLQLSVAADSRGPNGAPGTLTTTFAYEGRSNRAVRVVDPRGAVEVFARDERGLQVSVVEASGSAEASETRFSHNAYGQPLEVTNANGHTTQFDYFPDGAARSYLKSVTADADGQTVATRYESDARGNIIATISPRGVRFQQTLNEVDWIVAITQAVTGSSDGAPPLNYASRFRYDENGNVVEERVPFGDGDASTRETFTYGPLDEILLQIREIEPGGPVATTTRSYDANLNLETQVDPEGQVRRLTYDERNLPVALTRGFGTPVAVTQALVYDPEGHRISANDGRGATWSQLYDGFGRVRESRDPLGNKTDLAYDASGNVIHQKNIDNQEALMAESVSEFDLLGRMTVDRELLWSPGTTTSRALESRFEYDRVGNLKKKIDPLGRETVMAYDGAERLVSVTDPAGNVTVRTLDADGNPTAMTARERTPDGTVVPVRTTMSFDALGRRASAADALGNAWRSIYDARGNVRVAIDPENNITANTFDGLGRLVKQTKPEGIEVAYSYDRSSRMVSLRDALGHETHWGYDALDRRTQATYPDTTQEIFAYDASDNLRQVRDARGTVIDQVYDPAGRLTSRTITPASGVEGALTEHYDYDGLRRLIRAQSGAAVTERQYDSLSRMVSEKTGGQEVAYQHDDTNNRTRVQYPSGQTIGQDFDELDRPVAVGHVVGSGQSEAIDPLVSYTYRGVSKLAGKVLSNGVTGSLQFDTADRLIHATMITPQGLKVVNEDLSWNPRGLEIGQARGDLNGAGLIHAYDGAGRLLRSASVPFPLTAAPNNVPTDPAVLAGLPETVGFTYDPAENLVSRTVTRSGAALTDALPLDGSGRNRPASVNGKALEWDANGNLVRKGDLRFSYDSRNRLVRVAQTTGGDVAAYTYDAFNRRITKTVAGETRETVWKDWQPIEEYKGGHLASRRTYGAGLDEMVRIENDLNGDGAPDVSLAPVYDSTGNLVALTGQNGKPVERYTYSPYGEQTILVDSTPPVVEQVRVKGSSLWLEMSEEVDFSALASALASGKLALLDTTHGTPIALSVQQPVHEGLQARRRLVLTLTPAAVPAQGTAMRLVIQPEALIDQFHNQPAAVFEETFPWPAGDIVLRDQTPPRIEQIVVRDHHLEVELSEEPDLAAAATALRVDGQARTWSLGADRYTLRSDAAFGVGTHQLVISTGPLDLQGLGLAEARQYDVQVGDVTTLSMRRDDPRKIPVSAVGSSFGFHGMQKDLETGLLYARNRYYDPEMGRFISADPLGYAGGPNAYTFAGNDPVNKTDSLGLYEEDVHHYLTTFLAETVGFDKVTAEDIGVQTQELDMDQRDAMYGGANHENFAKYHFVSFDRLMEMQDHALSGKTMDKSTRIAIGEFLHALEDSYSHQSNDTTRDFDKRYKDFSWIYNIGHGVHFHDPDWTWERPELAMSMARDTYRALVSVCKQYRWNQCTPHPFGTVSGRVYNFIVFKPQFYTDLYMHIPVTDVVDYTEKIQQLDPTYKLTDREFAKRHNRYLAYLEREKEAKKRAENSLPVK